MRVFVALWIMLSVFNYGLITEAGGNATQTHKALYSFSGPYVLGNIAFAFLKKEMNGDKVIVLNVKR